MSQSLAPRGAVILSVSEGSLLCIAEILHFVQNDELSATWSERSDEAIPPCARQSVSYEYVEIASLRSQ